MEVRQLSKPESVSSSLSTSSNDTSDFSTFSIVLSAPINGRIIALIPFRHPSSDTDYIFFLTENKKYAVISYDSSSKSSSSNSYNHNLITHSSGDLSEYGLAIRGNEPELGFLATLEPTHKCIALHLYDGYVTILPIHQSYRYKPYTSATMANNSNSSTSSSSLAQNDFLGPAYHCRIEETNIFSMEFLLPNKSNSSGGSGSRNFIMPQLAFLHQDVRGQQHVIAHSLDLAQKQLIPYNVKNPSLLPSSSPSAATSSKKTKGTSSQNSSGGDGESSNQIQPPPMHQRLKKSRVEGSSGIIIPIPPFNIPTSSKIGGVLILGHRRITYHHTGENNTKTLIIPPCLIESYVQVVNQSQYNSSGGMMDDINCQNNIDPTLRYLLGDDSGRIHLLAVVRDNEGKVTSLHLDSLGEANVSSSLVYLDRGIFFLGSQSNDSQLIEILDEPVEINSSSLDLVMVRE